MLCISPTDKKHFDLSPIIYSQFWSLQSSVIFSLCCPKKFKLKCLGISINIYLYVYVSFSFYYIIWSQIVFFFLCESLSSSRLLLALGAVVKIGAVCPSSMWSLLTLPHVFSLHTHTHTDTHAHTGLAPFCLLCPLVYQAAADRPPSPPTLHPHLLTSFASALQFCSFSVPHGHFNLQQEAKQGKSKSAISFTSSQ